MVGSGVKKREVSAKDAMQCKSPSCGAEHVSNSLVLGHGSHFWGICKLHVIIYTHVKFTLMEML